MPCPLPILRERSEPMAKKVVPVRNSGYDQSGASWQKQSLKAMIPNSRAPWEDIDSNNFTLRQRSRMLYMASPIGASAIKTNRTNVVGNGLKLQSNINRQVLGMTKEQAEEWQKKTEAEFELWASKKNACDATGMNDFYGIQQLALMSWLMSGDTFAIIKRYDRTSLQPYGLRIHLIEADRVRTPIDNGLEIRPGIIYDTRGTAPNGNDIYDGVEVDKNGKVVAYYVANTYPFEPTLALTDFVRIEAYNNVTGLPNILHIMDSERPDQYRGVPYLAQIIEPVLQTNRYTNAEIMAAVVQSFHTAFITTESDPTDMPFNEAIPDYEQISEDRNDYEMGPGTINILQPGEDVRFNTPTHPNTAFDVFMKSICTQIGSALEIPRDLLLKEFNASYSASRAAMLEAWKAFKMRREWLTNDFCKPVYEIWLTEAIALGRIQAPGFFNDPLIRQAYLGSEWIGPAQGQLDGTKEIQAATMAIEAGLSTREQEAIKLNGSDYAANADKLAVENEKLRQANTSDSAQNISNEENFGENFANYLRKTVENTVKSEVEKIHETE